MSKIFFPLCAAVLLFSSCKPEASSPSDDGPYSNSYSSTIEYKNASSANISFKNAAPEPEEYTLNKGEIRIVSSDKRGRGSIIEIKPAYVTWKQNKDMYHIEFVDREEKYALLIENKTGREIILTERSGYLKPAQIRVTADSKIYEYGASTGTSSTEYANSSSASGTNPFVYVYTKNPTLAFDDGSTGIIKKSGRSTGEKFIYGIFTTDNPPSGWN